MQTAPPKLKEAPSNSSCCFCFGDFPPPSSTGSSAADLQFWEITLSVGVGWKNKDVSPPRKFALAALTQLFVECFACPAAVDIQGIVCCHSFDKDTSGRKVGGVGKFVGLFSPASKRLLSTTQRVHFDSVTASITHDGVQCNFSFFWKREQEMSSRRWERASDNVPFVTSWPQKKKYRVTISSSPLTRYISNVSYSIEEDGGVFFDASPLQEPIDVGLEQTCKMAGISFNLDESSWAVDMGLNILNWETDRLPSCLDAVSKRAGERLARFPYIPVTVGGRVFPLKCKVCINTRIGFVPLRKPLCASEIAEADALADAAAEERRQEEADAAANSEQLVAKNGGKAAKGGKAPSSASNPSSSSSLASPKATPPGKRGSPARTSAPPSAVGAKSAPSPLKSSSRASASAAATTLAAAPPKPADAGSAGRKEAQTPSKSSSTSSSAATAPKPAATGSTGAMKAPTPSKSSSTTSALAVPSALAAASSNPAAVNCEETPAPPKSSSNTAAPAASTAASAARPSSKPNGSSPSPIAPRSFEAGGFPFNLDPTPEPTPSISPSSSSPPSASPNTTSSTRRSEGSLIESLRSSKIPRFTSTGELAAWIHGSRAIINSIPQESANHIFPFASHLKIGKRALERAIVDIRQWSSFATSGRPEFSRQFLTLLNRKQLTSSPTVTDSVARSSEEVSSQ